MTMCGDSGGPVSRDVKPDTLRLIHNCRRGLGLRRPYHRHHRPLSKNFDDLNFNGQHRSVEMIHSAERLARQLTFTTTQQYPLLFRAFSGKGKRAPRQCDAGEMERTLLPMFLSAPERKKDEGLTNFEGSSLSACVIRIRAVHDAHRLAVIKEILPRGLFLRSFLIFDIATTDTLFTAENGQDQLRQAELEEELCRMVP